MEILIKSVVVLSIPKLIYTANFQLFPESAEVLEGEGLIITVLPKDRPFVTCTVKSAMVSLNFNDTSDSTNTTSNFVTYWGRGLSAGDCGVQILKYSAQLHEGKWRFTVSTQNETSQMFIELFTANEPQLPNIKNITTSLGQQVNIPCSSKDTMQCSLTDPSGNTFISGNSCIAEIQSVKMKDLGLWKCKILVREKAEEVVIEFAIEANPIKTIDLGGSQSEQTYDLHCNLLTNKDVYYCKIERPDGKVFLLKDGSSSGRYTYFGNGTNFNTCGISMKLPLEPYDKGFWLCTLHSKDGSQTGGFITVKDEEKGNTTSFSSIVTGPTDIRVANGSELAFKCSTKGQIKYCWLRHPNGTRFSPHPDEETNSYEYLGNGLELGDCGIKIAIANVSDSGPWACGMGVDTDVGLAQDVQMTISVLVSESRLVENRTSTVATVGDWSILGCRSLLGEGLQYCSFVAPNGTGYSLTSSGKPSSHPRYSYYGSGLEFGHCGLLINPVMKEDYGIWKCAAMLIDSQDSQEYYKNLQMNPPGFSTSSAVGIALGVIVVAIVGILLIIRHRRRLNQSRTGHSDIRPAALSMTSGQTDTSDELEMVATHRIQGSLRIDTP